MNTAQRAVLFTAALAILAMCVWPPCRSGGDGFRYINAWTVYWNYGASIAVSILIAQLAILLSLTTILVLAFKTEKS